LFLPAAYVLLLNTHDTMSGETSRLLGSPLGSIDENEERTNGNSTSCASNCFGGSIGECIGRYAFSTIVSAALGCCCLLLYAQLLSVQYQLHKEQEEIQHLEDLIEHDQKDEIESLNERVEAEHKAMIYHLAGTFVLIGGLITMFHMRKHMENMHEPAVQRKILAILAMCPIYSITSFLSVVFPTISGYLGVIRECYEAYVIYQFLSFLVAVLGKGDRSVVVELLARHADNLRPPLKCLNCLYYPDPEESPRAMANAVLLECQVLALQFVFLRPILSISLFVLDMMYEEPLPTWDFRSPKFYIVMVQNISVFAAFAGLLRFYHAVHDYIEWIQPWPKFLCIKGVVMITFWQGLVISFVASATAGGDRSKDNFDPDEWASQVQNLLICLEMLGFSIAHYFVFPTEEWEEGFIRKRLDMSVGDSIAFGDFVSDVKMVYKSSRSARANRADRKDYSTIGSSSTIPSEDIDNELGGGIGSDIESSSGDDGKKIVVGMDVVEK